MCVIWTIVGGTTRLYGPILGVVALTIIDEMVLRAIGIDQIRPLLYGVILIATILFLPKGLESLVIRFLERLPTTRLPARRAALRPRAGRPEQDGRHQLARVVQHRRPFAPPAGKPLFRLGLRYQLQADRRRAPCRAPR